MGLTLGNQDGAMQLYINRISKLTRTTNKSLKKHLKIFSDHSTSKSADSTNTEYQAVQAQIL